ncbi:MAG TPA: lycopene cyclase domain-containing protein, partial [Candidatus Binatia bacterium]|nr:lycopene cyclase domain-containing protein [Candidatus Binatia bacterium]
WVPIEEYTFFVLQPIFSALFLLVLLGHLQPAVHEAKPRARIRLLAVSLVAVLWLLSIYVLISRLQPGTYLALELVWALPPIMLQLAFGADVLWRYGKAVAPAVLLPTIFLSTADALAIGAGIWTINPAQSLHLYIGGVLPVEEFIFFLLTNTLVVFGATLSLAPTSRERLQQVARSLRRVVKQLKWPGWGDLRRSVEL